MESTLEHILLRENWGRTSFEIKNQEDPHLVSASIDLNRWKIFINYDDELANIDKLLTKYGNKGTLRALTKKNNYFTGKDNLSNLLHFLVGHEIGHWKYCPADKDDKEEIVSGISEGLKEAGFTPEEIKQHYHRLFNYFADIIDNVSNMYRDKNKQAYIDGFLAFYAKEGLIADGYTDDFYVFIDATTKLGIDNPKIKNFASIFKQKHEDLNAVTTKIMDLLVGDTRLVAKAEQQELTLEEKVGVYHGLNDRSAWHEKSKEFAKIIAPYIRQQEEYKNKTSGKEDEGSSDRNQQGKNGNKKQQSGQPQNQPENSQRDQDLREMIRRSLEKGHDTSYADRTTVLDELYKMRAEDILIDMIKKEAESLRLPIGYVSKKDIDDNFFDANKVDWQNPEITVDENGNDDLEFMEKQAPIFHTSKGSEKGGRIPDILFVIDRSGSVISGYDPIEGTGPYDMVMRLVYSVLRNLEIKGQIQQMRFGTILFDDKPNYFTGWHQYYNMDEVKDAILDPGNKKYGGLGSTTQLEQRVIEDADQEAQGRKYWTIVISDGGIHNLDEAKNAMKYLKDHGHYITYLDVNSPEMANLNNIIAGFNYMNHLPAYIKEIGGSVFNVSDPSKLTGLVLREAKDIFG